MSKAITNHESTNTPAGSALPSTRMPPASGDFHGSNEMSKPLNEIPGISDWMRQHHAEVIWAVQTPDGTVAAIEVKGVRFLIEFSEGQQWDVFLPVSAEEKAVDGGALVAMDQALLPTMA